MTDWLSEIEKTYGTIEEHNRTFGEVQLVRRMARMIRELVAWGKELELYELRKYKGISSHGVLLESVRDNLSPDAKELVK